MEQNNANRPQQDADVSQQAAVRRQKLADLRAAGQDPFTITRYPQDSFSADLKEEFADLPAEAETGKIVCLAGRMMSKRVMGKASFAHLRDAKGDIQIFVRRDVLGDEPYAAFKKLDIGDIIGVQGRGVPHQDGRAERPRQRDHPAGQEPAAHARKVPRPDRHARPATVSATST